MKWKKYTLTTTTAAEDLVSATLDDIGIEGVMIEDNIPLTDEETKGMFIDILPELPPDEGVSRISFYLDDDENADAMLQKAKEALAELAQFTDLGACTIEESETEDKDWINNWKQYFKPFTVDNILIKPTWEPVPEEHKDKLMIQIDPGTAFGTGLHETTQLCIRQLEKYIKGGEQILDVGTGSGILGIAALKLGAGYVFGTDLDENAIDAVAENLASNDIARDKFDVLQGNLLSGGPDNQTEEETRAVQEKVGFEKYDIVTANILAPVIIGLVPEIPQHLKKGGVFITSGIINTKEEDVVAAFQAEPSLKIVEINHQGEWVNVTAVKE
ncbi:ribosomal protein L11 methyltransferase [[Clostridium] aminophilum]|uniref:Ribosomal protein L11 methyltransferase n=1 Tax=[Clostridium] aminophilum TaxID=1526 RepID=A0A1I0D395_9FIRM|nr:50S ribosomal protein L11 methyltransferase [[Clostridium] aminophilum]SET26679.1 ribosomal protein L11 methyltransferase [[Clostridium] aminophilum]